MKRLSLIHLYELGHLTRLRELEVGDSPLRTLGIFTIGSLGARQFIASEENQMMFPNAVERARSLEKSIDSEVPSFIGMLAKPATQELVDNVFRLLSVFETSLEDDMRRVPGYYVERVGAFSTDQLIANADVVFSDTLRKSGVIPDQVIKDFRSAGACLAFDLGTACGFHAFRAADAMIRSYYAHFLRVTPAKEPKDWGGYIRALRDAIPKGQPNNPPAKVPNDRTVELLDSIRAMDRNPVIHPEVDLDADTALTTFDLCKNAIALMAIDIRDRP